jgi:hypothetical protein
MIESDRLRIVPFMTTPEKRIIAMETDPSGPAVTYMDLAFSVGYATIQSADTYVLILPDGVGVSREV